MIKRMRNNRVIYLSFIAVTAGLLIFFIINALLRPVHSFFLQKVISPIFVSASTAAFGVSDFFSGGGETNRLLGENDRLLAKAAEGEILKKENGELKKALGLGEILGREVLPVSPAGFFRFFGNEILTLSRGRESGIQAGDIVLTEDKVYVGRILVSEEGLSDVLLASSPAEVFDVVFVASGATARARGLSGGEFAIDFVPNEVDINREEFVGLVPKTASWPQGMVLGKVIDKGTGAGEIFREVSAVHLFNPFQPQSLFVALLGAKNSP